MQDKKSKTKKNPNETQIKFVELVDIRGRVTGYSLYDPKVNQVTNIVYDNNKVALLHGNIYIAMPKGTYCVSWFDVFESKASFLAVLIKKKWVDIDILRKLVSIVRFYPNDFRPRPAGEIILPPSE